MNEELRIGEKTSIPVGYITKVVSLLAMRGAGKTYTAGVISEELMDYVLSNPDNNANLIIIDPVGAHWGLRSHFPFHIIGGDHGDIEIDLESGKLFAEMVHKFKLNVIIDVSAYQQDQMALFVADFLMRLYQLTKEPTHIILEEADIFAPQRLTSAGQKMSLAAVDTVVRRGRGKGMGVTMITQRPAVLNKNVLTQSDAAFIMNMTGETDLKTVREYLSSAGATKGEIAKHIEQIMKFKKGQGLLFSPSWLKRIEPVTIRQRVSFHSGAEPILGEENPADKVKLIHMNIEQLENFLNGEEVVREWKADVRVRENDFSEGQVQRGVPDTDIIGQTTHYGNTTLDKVKLFFGLFGGLLILSVLMHLLL